MRQDIFYVMAFHSTSHSIQTEKKAKEQFKITVIPTPRELTNDCGLAIKFMGDSLGNEEHLLDKIKCFQKELTVPSDLYAMTQERIDGKRKVEKIL